MNKSLKICNTAGPNVVNYIFASRIHRHVVTIVSSSQKSSETKDRQKEELEQLVILIVNNSW